MKNCKGLFLPLIFSIMSLFCTGELVGFLVRRGLVILTLGIILWTIYKQFGEPILVVKRIVTVIIIGLVSLLFIFIAIYNSGW